MWWLLANCADINGLALKINIIEDAILAYPKFFVF
jgi:hypothetical protein